MDPNFQQGLRTQPAKRSIFVSYHHGGDRAYYDAFSRLFANSYQLVGDNSVERTIDCDDAEYVIRKIREDYITGSSCTVVLCGAETPNRKFVDWEIKATLDKQHGLVGVYLPTNPALPNGNVVVPARLFDNIQSGYAIWANWSGLTLNPTALPRLVEEANGKSKLLIRNGRDLRYRNG